MWRADKVVFRRYLAVIQPERAAVSEPAVKPSSNVGVRKWSPAVSPMSELTVFRRGLEDCGVCRRTGNGIRV